MRAEVLQSTVMFWRTGLTQTFQNRESVLICRDGLVRAAGLGRCERGRAHERVAARHAGARRTVENGVKVVLTGLFFAAPVRTGATRRHVCAPGGETSGGFR
ncbi:hypothetical protein HED60_11960 [Planctomycetales bacterium ZRK34]|nr:hypothetical protein HED60_11960 [Planctomycetales bacterium ZRK34]